MFDINEIMKRAQKASDQAADAMKRTLEKSEEIQANIQEPVSASEETGQINANAQRQVEILGQMFDPDSIAQMAANQELLQKMVDEKAAQAAASNAEGLIGDLFGEDMAVIAAALETLEMEDENGQDNEPFSDAELEQKLYGILEEAMARIGSLPEQEPIPYQKDDGKWERFGILLSGIVSSLNDHSLDGMDVEEHIPVLEQQVLSVVRRSWGINGRADLLDMIRYLAQEGYVLRYRLYSEAASPEELLDEDTDEEDRESACRAWRFVQRYKSRYASGFLTGWDTGRAAMLARWGCYLGWITEGEAVGILRELSLRAAEELHDWREFAQSYLFGGLMWKLLCGDSSAESYLGYLADAATDLLAGKGEGTSGQWRGFPWPARRRIGF